VKTYQELITFDNFEDRFNYLKLSGRIGDETFGSNRWVNQIFYKSREWLSFRDRVIRRDNGCDLGVEGREIFGPILIHHINPITLEDIVERDPKVFDMNNVITTMLSTHNAIHYSDAGILVLDPVERTQNDTCPWR